MFGFMLFVHLTGLFVWLGALMGTLVMLGLLKNQLGSPDTNQLAKRLIRMFSMLSHPGALLVLVSGVYMIVQMGAGSDKPLWLDVMEKGGGTIILLAIVLTGILGSKVKKRLSEGAGAGQPAKLSGYVAALSTFMVLIVSVVLVVSLRI